MIVGRYDIGATATVLAINKKRVARFTLSKAGLLSKGSAYLDGNGGAVGSQALKFIVYDADRNLVAVSEEVEVAEGDDPAWIDFTFIPAAQALPIGDYFVGLHSGGADGVARVFGSTPAGLGGLLNTDTYSDGPADPFGGSVTALTATFAVFLTVSEVYEHPDETDLYFSRMPFSLAQAALGVGGPVARTARASKATWHSTFLDPETGANALVRDGSPLADLLGERIFVKRTGVSVERAVYVYVHDLMDAAEPVDISLTRLAYSRLGALGGPNIDVSIEVAG